MFRFFLFCALLIIVISCSHTSFTKYYDKPLININTSLIDDTNSRRISAFDSSFVWTDCEDVASKVIKKLASQVEEGEVIANIEWYNYKNNRYIDEQRCLTEQGWAWGIYLFWWPKATKVKARARIISNKDFAAIQKKLAFEQEREANKLALEQEKEVKKYARLKDLKYPLSINSFEITRRVGEYDRKYVGLKLTVFNNGKRSVSAYHLNIKVSSKLGTSVGKIKLVNDSSNIQPLGEETETWEWEDNQFINDEVYDKLTRVSAENLIIKILNQKVVKRKN